MRLISKFETPYIWIFKLYLADYLLHDCKGRPLKSCAYFHGEKHCGYHVTDIKLITGIYKICTLLPPRLSSFRLTWTCCLTYIIIINKPESNLNNINPARRISSSSLSLSSLSSLHDHRCPNLIHSSPLLLGFSRHLNYPKPSYVVYKVHYQYPRDVEISERMPKSSLVAHCESLLRCYLNCN